VGRDETLSILKAHLAEVRAFGVKSLALFGSVSRDEAKPQSDVDLLVEFDGPATFDRFMGLKLFAEDLLGRTVDLVTKKGLRSQLRPQVEREAIRVA
jgi:predicted nucleotidyltransferase